ncbi:MAG: hydrogenase maturation protease [Chloroflexi bacterium]|nr:hydrogenase maturation protease [Chloroflexota bacterium]
MPRILIIGCGNLLAGDDAAGLLAARALKNEGVAGVEIVEAHAGGSALVDIIDGADAVFIVDAMVTGAPPGTIHRFERDDLPAIFSTTASSHDFGVAEALALYRALWRHRTVPRLAVFGIELESVEFGRPLSDAVVQALPGLVAMLREEVVALARGDTEM